MIVREREHEFVMIEQHNHAQVSGDIMSNWKNSLFIGNELRKSVEYAIYHHDIGWRHFDTQPFWDDQANKPFTFSSFPTNPKIVLYTYGINEVEEIDSYAALLCSKHYTHFLKNNPAIESQQFVKNEEERQQRLWSEIPQLNKRLFNFHYGLVQLGDNLSLYLCLNEPGITKEKEHPFFKEGIPLNKAITSFQQSKMTLHWLNKKTVTVHEFPFEDTFQIKWNEKIVSKQTIREKGLLKAYTQAPIEERKVQFKH